MNENVKTNGRLLLDENMAKYTSWRVGGNAEKMYLPYDKDDLVLYIKTLLPKTPVFWLGLGSNLLVRDGGIAGVVINTRGRLKKMTLQEAGVVYVEAGMSCARVARFCADHGLVGAEFLAGIPGTMGGALKMNAGAFGHETWGIVGSVEMLNRHGETYSRTADDFKISYRSVTPLTDEWFISVTLKLTQGDSARSLQKIKALLKKRADTQPINVPTCGSVFKNPTGDYAARLIESCDLKGYQIGGACVSEKHANFIVNYDNATARDIEALIQHVQEEVNRQQKIKLETEVCKVGAY
ncbi:MAG: UDP-N-acetylmuramate dehydrogenase [Methylococcales bacterium]|nr:UDP-N-acetylmuramate dehydrogenase [Methylococcales bacterium]